MGSMKLELTPGGGGPAGGNGSIFPSILQIDYRIYSKKKEEKEIL